MVVLQLPQEGLDVYSDLPLNVKIKKPKKIQLVS